MRIGIFTDTYKPDINGVATSITIVENALKARGHEVFVFAPNQELKYRPLTQEHIWRLPSVTFFGEKRYRAAIPYLFHKDIYNIPIDIVHTQTAFSVGSIGLQFARKKHLPAVHTYHTRYQEYAHYLHLPNFILKFIAKSIMGKIIRFVNKHDEIIVPSVGIRQELKSFGVSRPISIIPTGIDIAKTISMANAKEPDSILAKLNIDKNAELVVFTSRLGKEKNIKFLLGAMLAVINARPQVYFLVIGDGSEKENLKKIIGQMGIGHRVIFTGFMNHDTIFPIYRVAKVFVFSSQTETQGLALLEAMALGLPIVALRATGIEDLLENNIGGFLIEKVNPDAFARAVIGLLENPGLREKKIPRSAESRTRFFN